MDFIYYYSVDFLERRFNGFGGFARIIVR